MNMLALCSVAAKRMKSLENRKTLIQHNISNRVCENKSIIQHWL